MSDLRLPGLEPSSEAFFAPPLSFTIGTDGARGYKRPETGEVYVSVTTVPRILDRPALVHWQIGQAIRRAWQNRAAFALIEDEDVAVAMAADEGKRKMRRSGLRGSTIHRVCEALARGAELPSYRDEEVPYVDAFLRFVEDYSPTFRYLESTVFSDTYRYAGTLDWIADVDGLTIIGDTKTGSGIYAEATLQLAALRFAELVWNPVTGDLDPMPKIDGAVGLHLQPDGYRLLQVHADEEAFRCYVGLRTAWDWAHDGGAGGRSVGPVLAPSRFRKAFAA